MATKTKKYTDYSKKQAKTEAIVANEPIESVEKPATKAKTVHTKYEPEKYVVTCDLLNFRSTPEIGDNLMLQLPKGETLIHNALLMDPAPEGWIFVEHEKAGVKVGGYVMRKFIERV